MFGSPLPHPLQVGRASKHLAVLRFTQPAALALSFAGLATLGVGTKPLMPPIAMCGTNNCLQCRHSRRSRLGTQQGEQTTSSEVNPECVETNTSKKTDRKKRTKSSGEAVDEQHGPRIKRRILSRHYPLNFPPRFPLFAIADLCGYGPAARNIAITLCRRDDKQSLAVELLADIAKHSRPWVSRGPPRHQGATAPPLRDGRPAMANPVRG